MSSKKTKQISRRVYNTFCPSLVGELAIAP